MTEHKIQVTPGEFCDKMNERLRREPACDGTEFQYDKDGFVLIAPSLSETSKMAISKVIFDEVSVRYTITSG